MADNQMNRGFSEVKLVKLDKQFRQDSVTGTAAHTGDTAAIPHKADKAFRVASSAVFKHNFQFNRTE